jgi:antitoxin ParD1/3/4
MEISLSPELEQLIADRINTGRYHSVSEVIRDALRLREEHERLREMRLETLRQDAQIGIEQANRREVVDGDTVFENLRKRIDAVLS